MIGKITKKCTSAISAHYNNIVFTIVVKHWVFTVDIAK